MLVNDEIIWRKCMAIWPWKQQKTVFHETSLPERWELFHSPLISQSIGDQKLISLLPHDDSISLRVSSISISRKDDNDESAGKISIQDRATDKGVQFHEIEDKSYFSFEETSREDGVPLLIEYWQIGCKNTIVILSATIVAKYINNKTVSSNPRDNPYNHRISENRSNRSCY